MRERHCKGWRKKSKKIIVEEGTNTRETPITIERKGNRGTPNQKPDISTSPDPSLKDRGTSARNGPCDRQREKIQDMERRDCNIVILKRRNPNRITNPDPNLKGGWDGWRLNARERTTPTQEREELLSDRRRYITSLAYQKTYEEIYETKTESLTLILT